MKKKKIAPILKTMEVGEIQKYPLNRKMSVCSAVQLIKQANVQKNFQTQTLDAVFTVKRLPDSNLKTFITSKIEGMFESDDFIIEENETDEVLEIDECYDFNDKVIQITGKGYQDIEKDNTWGRAPTCEASNQKGNFEIKIFKNEKQIQKYNYYYDK
jgi:hypothetical protein